MNQEGNASNSSPIWEGGQKAKAVQPLASGGALIPPRFGEGDHREAMVEGAGKACFGLKAKAVQPLTRVFCFYAALMLSLSAPALAQSQAIGEEAPAPNSAEAIVKQYRERLVIVFGNDACPPSRGDEIIVCARKPESERYRIPEHLRKPNYARNSRSWADRAKSLETVGRSGAMSCSTVGAGGWTGCFSDLMSKAREEARENQ